MNFEKIYNAIGIQDSTDDYRRQQFAKMTKHETAKYMVFKPGVCQADLQFYGKEESTNKSKRDHNNLILLVVVDIMTKMVDFEPVPNKEGKSIRWGFVKILRRNIIREHGIKHLYSDNGSEFKNVIMQRYCKAQNIIQHFTLPSRKKQNAIVEAFNSVLRKLLTLKQNQNIKDGVKDANGNVPHIFAILPLLRTAMNDKKVKWPLIRDFILPVKNEKINEKDPDEVKENGGVIPINTLVYIKNERPQDVNGHASNHFKFRMGDYYYSKKIHNVEQILAYPNGNSIRYKVSGVSNATYSKSELLPVLEKEILDREKPKIETKQRDKILTELGKEIKKRMLQKQFANDDMSKEEKEKLNRQIKVLSDEAKRHMDMAYNARKNGLQTSIREKKALLRKRNLSVAERKDIHDEIKEINIKLKKYEDDHNHNQQRKYEPKNE